MSYKKSPFENAPKKHPNKTRFNMSHEHKMQMEPGNLYPCMRPLEVMPGDEVSIQSQIFMRWESLYFPIIHKITMRADLYYTPYRILWPGEYGEGTNVGWVNWLTKMEEVAHPTTEAWMSYNTTSFTQNVLSYMGIPLLPPTGTAGYDETITGLNAFPLSALLMIWDWYERNPQLEDEIWFPLQDGVNTTAFQAAFGTPGASFPVLSAKWEKDMFTSALPQPQVGTAITIPMVKPFDEIDPALPNAIFRDVLTGLAAGAAPTIGTAAGGFPQSSIGEFLYYDPQTVAATIKQLREAEVLQSFHERIMKVGDRYDDYIQGLYGVDPQPGIINIPVLIGSIFGKVQISDVIATADVSALEDERAKAGDYRGNANLYEEGQQMKYTCNEHGVILMIIQVNANTGYGQGIDRMWRRSVQTDYPLDMFATIGDQEILKEEVLYTGNTADRIAGRFQETFGYIDRFAESKFMNDVYVGTLGINEGKSQHLGRWWDPLTTTGAIYSDNIVISGGLYDGFISATSRQPNGGGHRLTDVFRLLPTSGTAPSSTQGTIWSWIFHSIWINRSLPLYSTPSL